MPRLGQHFLYDHRIAQKMARAAGVGPRDVVLEIGPGRGLITAELASKAKKVFAIEKDSRLAVALEGKFSNVKIIQGNAAKVDWPYFDKLVANLPFQISAPVLGRLFLSGKPAVLILQKEFAARLVAKPGAKDYSRLSVASRYYCTAEVVGKLKPGAFKPAPKVSAVMVKIIPRRPPFKTDKRFWVTLTRLFQHRRKTVRAALKAAHLKAELTPSLEKKRLFKCGLYELKRIVEAVK